MRISPVLLAGAVALALLVAACGGEADSSGLATLTGSAPVPEAVPESEEVETAGIVTSPPESTETTAATSTETTTSTTEDTAAEDDPPVVTATQPAPAEPAEGDADAAEETVDAAEGDAAAGEGDADAAEEAMDADLSDEERLLHFADCMRDNGVDFPDPVVEADGTVRFGFRPGAGGAGAAQELVRDPDLPAAREACEGLLQGLSFGPGSGNFDTTELQDALLEFARCMRDNGVNIGDPDLRDFGPGRGGGDGPAGGPFAGIDFEDPDVAAALEVCQAEVNIGRFGRGGPRSDAS